MKIKKSLLAALTQWPSSPQEVSQTSSPKTEDRILDCALLFNKLRSNQNIVILSNSITLKIKAMAEGLLCEGAKEFRETLMDPCSSRFMWAASAPRRSAWSCLDETALTENYYNSHHGARRRIPRSIEAAKGLKLILLHSSLYAQPRRRRTPSRRRRWPHWPCDDDALEQFYGGYTM